MDAFVQVALIQKAKQVFASDEELFLSFPILSPISFKQETLKALLTPSSAADYAAAADFARIVNFLPKDIVATFDGEAALWDVYEDVLYRSNHATAASGAVSDGRRAAVDALLHTVDDEGNRHESPAYVEYLRYRDAWFAARENYNNHRVTAENSADPAVQQQWRDTDEPALRKSVDQAVTDWENLGRRSEIEAAVADLAAAAASDPIAQWSDWQTSFNPDIDLVTADTTSFAATGYSPRDLDDDSNWLDMSMQADEIASLAAAAPEQLRVANPGSIESLTCQYRSVAITRPWFNSAVFTSGLWQCAPGQQPLSDGGDPAHGRLPAYATALVLVRNLSVKTKVDELSAPVGVLRFTLAAKLLTNREILSADVLKQKVQPAAVPPPAVMNPHIKRAFSRVALQSFDAAPGKPARIRPRIDVIRAGGLMMTRPAPAPPPPGSVRLRFPLRFRVPNLAGRRFTRADSAASTPAPAPDPPPPPPAAEAAPSTISVLAFVCKKLPKAPDPLPDLVWN